MMGQSEFNRRLQILERVVLALQEMSLHGGRLPPRRRYFANLVREYHGQDISAPEIEQVLIKPLSELFGLKDSP
jgi:RNase P/RNase MRP subunit POP5